jgi:hypothetical protein
MADTIFLMTLCVCVCVCVCMYVCCLTPSAQQRRTAASPRIFQTALVYTYIILPYLFYFKCDQPLATKEIRRNLTPA